MTRGFAAEIAGWRYPPPYEIYGYADADREETVRHLADGENRFFAVLKEGDLVGFRSFGEDGRVAGGIYDDDYLDTGGGLRPDLTGLGHGPEVIRKGLAFGQSRFGVRRFRVTIADFNQRAQKACRKLGFSASQHFRRRIDGEPFTIYLIELKEG